MLKGIFILFLLYKISKLTIFSQIFVIIENTTLHKGYIFNVIICKGLMSIIFFYNFYR